MNENCIEHNAPTYLKEDYNTTNFAISVNNVKIEIVILNFSNRILVTITQFGKLGTLVSVNSSFLAVGEAREASYDIKTLFGDDQLNYHVAARFLAESIGVDKPILFAIALSDLTFPALQKIRTAILEKKSW